MKHLITEIKGWANDLEEATECDPDLGDPYTCIDDVRNIVRKMKKRAWLEEPDDDRDPELESKINLVSINEGFLPDNDVIGV